MAPPVALVYHSGFFLQSFSLAGARRSLAQTTSSRSTNHRLLPGPRKRRRSSPTLSNGHCCCSLNSKSRRQYTSVMIVPTGVGASIGGYAGDALPVARALASVVDCLISHPNVLNAAMLYWPMANVLYVEGYALDRFAEGSWALQPVHQNRVGLVLDSGMEAELITRHLQVADATRASLGLPVMEYIVTDHPLEVEKWIDPASGKSTGRIKNPDTLFRAVSNLVSQVDVNAVAVVGRFPDDDTEDMDDYRRGVGVDLLAGLEAVISHLIVKTFCIPCAHAPALAPFPISTSLCPRSAAEEIGYTFLPCVLAGLSKAPQYIVRKPGMTGGCIIGSDVDSVILPINACGGDAALAFARSMPKYSWAIHFFLVQIQLHQPCISLLISDPDNSCRREPNSPRGHTRKAWH